MPNLSSPDSSPFLSTPVFISLMLLWGPFRPLHPPNPHSSKFDGFKHFFFNLPPSFWNPGPIPRRVFGQRGLPSPPCRLWIWSFFPARIHFKWKDLLTRDSDRFRFSLLPALSYHPIAGGSLIDVQRHTVTPHNQTPPQVSMRTGYLEPRVCFLFFFS